MTYRFSQQQIAGINYYFGRIADGMFDEDDVRLLLIHLREFLLNGDNVRITSQGNAGILREIGHSIAHTIRDRGEIYDRIKGLVQEFASVNRGGNWSDTPFTLFDADKVIDGLKDVLVSSGVMYARTEVKSAFNTHRLDLKICLLSMLHGLVFKVSYPESSKDFYVLKPEREHFIYIRTELDLSNVTSLRQLRLNARIPIYGGGNFHQCILLCELPVASKVEPEALERTASPEGYCESVKALRRNGQLVIAKLDAGVCSEAIFTVLRACSYDTHPISQGVELRRIES